ncbi:MAG: CoB--CoM heterodisulfide reductase subunit B [Thermoprotei archaeon]|nr:MAG: CoB--CoM heterodisulfide reductase subunit B [Thermoprotei archaeon]
MVKLSFFVGCTSAVREVNYEISAKAVLESLGVELEYIEGQSCCGLPFRYVSFDSWLTLASRNIALAELTGNPMLVLCSGCYKSFKEALSLISKPELKKSVNERLSIEGLEVKGGLKVIHIAELLHDHYGVDRLAQQVKVKLNLNVAVHPGCHIVRPMDVIGFDNPEVPLKLEKLVELTGCNSIQYRTKRECCGATLAGIDQEASKSLVARKIMNIKGRADALITFCPICHASYDAMQRAALKPEDQVPVLHYTQLLGLALGLPPEKLGFDYNRVSVDKVLAKIKNTP